MLRKTKTAFNYIDETMKRKTTTMMRPKLENTEPVSIWHKKQKQERSQGIASKLVPDLKKLTYGE